MVMMQNADMLDTKMFISLQDDLLLGKKRERNKERKTWEEFNCLIIREKI